MRTLIGVAFPKKRPVLWRRQEKQWVSTGWIGESYVRRFLPRSQSTLGGNLWLLCQSVLRSTSLVAIYLAAIVAANLSVAEWGPRAAIYNAFLLIGLDLTTRDVLHELWRGRLVRNMALLIASGSALSYLMGLWLGTGPFVARIALASMIAFGSAALVDALLYHFLREYSWYERVNGSNIGGAATDSLVFVALWPFGFQFTYAFTLFSAKVAGGVVWATVLRGRERYVEC